MLCIAACATGIDPRRFSDLRYGMAAREVETALGSESSDRWRVMATGQRGAWCIDRYAADHPHPHYYVACRDGELVSVLTAGFVAEELTNGYPPTAAYMDGIIDRFAAERHPLSWSELEVIDREQLSEDLHPATYTALVVVAMPPVWVALPFYPFMLLVDPLLAGELGEARHHIVTLAMSLPSLSTREHVVATQGQPSVRRRHMEDPYCELWHYEVQPRAVSALACRMLFDRERLVWVQVFPANR